MQDAWSTPSHSAPSISHKLRVTTKALTKWSRSTFSANHSQIALLQQQLQQYTNQPSFETIAALLWHIWKARNHLIFRNYRTNPELLIDTALHMADLCLSSQQIASSSGSILQNRETSWQPPKQGIIKINMDAAFVSPNHTGAIASIFRDHTGKMLDGFTVTVPASTAT